MLTDLSLGVINKRNVLSNRNSFMINLSEVIAEFRARMGNLDPNYAYALSDDALMLIIADATCDAISVIANMELDEAEQIRKDPTWGYPNHGCIADPTEAFHFDAVEEIVTFYIKSTVGEPVKPVSFNATVCPYVILTA